MQVMMHYTMRYIVSMKNSGEKDFGDSGDSYVSDDYPSLVKEMLDAGYIDQAKADNFNNNINSESTRMEIDKTYGLFVVDLNVKRRAL